MNQYPLLFLVHADYYLALIVNEWHLPGKEVFVGPSPFAARCCAAEA